MRLLFALSTAAALFFSPVQALDCSDGTYMADAQVVPPASLGRVLRATQFAWDGGNRLSHVCNLTSGTGEFVAFWRVYSREVNQEFSGICIMLTGTSGQDMYSCATGAAVERARNSSVGARAFRLHFDRWQPGLRANITQ